MAMTLRYPIYYCVHGLDFVSGKQDINNDAVKGGEGVECPFNFPSLNLFARRVSVFTIFSPSTQSFMHYMTGKVLTNFYSNRLVIFYNNLKLTVHCI